MHKAIDTYSTFEFCPKLLYLQNGARESLSFNLLVYVARIVVLFYPPFSGAAESRIYHYAF
jgi:hypothetical protein